MVDETLGGGGRLLYLNPPIPPLELSLDFGENTWRCLIIGGYPGGGGGGRGPPPPPPRMFLGGIVPPRFLKA